MDRHQQGTQGEVKMTTVTKLLSLIHDEDGQDLIEYALVAGLIGIGAIVSLGGLGTKIKTAFNTVGSTLTSAT
jgi:pilus assembly protein Flp/PilA